MNIQWFRFFLPALIAFAVATPWADAHARSGGGNSPTAIDNTAEPVTATETTEGNASVLPQSATGKRTVDMLTEAELEKLKVLEADYFTQVSNEALPLVKIHFDTSTMLRIFPEQIRSIVRQRHRHALLGIEQYLYSLRLNSDFITSYISRLRDDVVNYTLDEMLKRSSKMTGATR